VPRLDTLRLRATTVGLYDQNRFDGNPVIGNWPGRLDNFYLATGFSGHGLMHAVGVGRGLAELMLHGRYRTIDLNPLGYERILAGSRTPRKASSDRRRDGAGRSRAGQATATRSARTRSPSRRSALRLPRFSSELLRSGSYRS
jgi:hypothetical protein